MSALPVPTPTRDLLPDYLPARMVNEYVYCPRLFFYEWVENVFEQSADTVEGKAQHRRVDEKVTELPPPEALGEERIHARSITLSSDRHRVIAKMDLVEAEAGEVTPVDYKHGHPRTGADGAGTLAGRPCAACRAGSDPARQRLPLRRGHRLLRQDRPAGAGGV